MTATIGKQALASDTQDLIFGANKHFASVPSISLRGHAYTPAEIIALLEALVTLRSDVRAAQAMAKSKIAIEKAQSPALLEVRKAFVAYVRAVIGTPELLADFGLRPPKPNVTSVHVKVAAAAKRRATRAARHTMGSQQRKAVKGNVTGVIVTPLVEPKSTPLGSPSDTPAPASPPPTQAASV